MWQLAHGLQGGQGSWSPLLCTLQRPSFSASSFYVQKDKRQDSSRAYAQPHTVFLKQQLGGSESNSETAHPHNKEGSTRLQCREQGQRLVK